MSIIPQETFQTLANKLFESLNQKLDNFSLPNTTRSTTYDFLNFMEIVCRDSENFLSVNLGSFTFKEGGQHYKSIGTLSSNSNVKVIIQDSPNVKAPEFSHTPNRIYAVVKKGQLKHLAYYDENHKQAVSIDFAHKHQGIQPHRHVYLNHDKGSPGIPPTALEDELIKKIKKEFQLR